MMIHHNIIFLCVIVDLIQQDRSKASQFKSVFFVTTVIDKSLIVKQNLNYREVSILLNFNICQTKEVKAKVKHFFLLLYCM